MSFERPDDLDDKLVRFIDEFFKVTDDPHGDYLQFFEPDGRMIIGGGQVLQGHEAIQARRVVVASSTNIMSRLHITEKVYWAGKGNDIMLYGTLQYGLSNGTQSPKLDWAARMLFGKSVPLRMEEYKVWMDSAALSKVLNPAK